jgi:hypothetical protein
VDALHLLQVEDKGRLHQPNPRPTISAGRRQLCIWTVPAR